MGYNLYIGNAEPSFSKADDVLDARWRVAAVKVPEAPNFPNDCAEHANFRYPSYSVWAEFCRTVGIYDLFYDKWEGLLCRHPGCMLLKPEHHIKIKAALDAYKLKTTLPPGFDECDSTGEASYDPILARLIWLEFWVRWALENCETPAIENS